jgi:PAS domain S-box-containing protein
MTDWLEAFARVPKSIKTGYALMALAFLLFAALAATGKLNQRQIGLLVPGMFIAALSCVLLLRQDLPLREVDATDGRNPSRICRVALKDAVDSSQSPMYLLDNNFVVQHCNDAFLSFLGAKRSEVVEKHVTDLIDKFAVLVPENRREAYVERQRKVLREGGTATSAVLSEIVDFSQRTASIERRIFRIWIQADLVRCAGLTKEVGSFVRYHLVEIDRKSGKIMAER